MATSSAVASSCISRTDALSASGRASANSASSAIAQKKGPANSAGGSTIFGPRAAASSTSAATAAILSASSGALSGSWSAATAIVSIAGGYFGSSAKSTWTETRVSVVPGRIDGGGGAAVCATASIALPCSGIG